MIVGKQVMMVTPKAAVGVSVAVVALLLLGMSKFSFGSGSNASPGTGVREVRNVTLSAGSGGDADSSSAAAPPKLPPIQGLLQWANGSWMRVVTAPTGCEPFPAVRSVAVACPSASNLCSTGEATLVIQVAEGLTPVEGRSSRCRVKSIAASSVSMRHFEVVLTGCNCSDRGGQSSPDSAATFGSTAVEHVDFLLKTDIGALPPPVCFASIGDWGAPHEPMLKVAAALSSFAEKNMYKFIISTGDNFYPTGVKSASDGQFQKAFEQPFKAPALRNVRWFISLGNHDQWGWSGQVEYGKTHARWYLPAKSYWSRVPLSGGVEAEIITLDTYGRDLKRQLALLQQRLESASTDSNILKIVLNHAPIFSGSMHGQQPGTKQLRAQLKPIIDKYRAHMYLNGDDHTLEVHRSQSTDYFVTGAGGGSAKYTSSKLPETQWYAAGGVWGFMHHCFDGKVVRTTLIDEAGKELYTHETPMQNE